MKKLDIEELKKEYVGKIFHWLTVIDVFRDDKKKIRFKCICKCGKECIKDFGKVIIGHTSSCGCFKFTKDYSDKLKSVWEANPDKVKEKTEKVKQWFKDNPDRVAERSRKYRKTIAENPEILIKQKAKRKDTFDNNPEIQEKISEKLRLFYSDENNRKYLSDKMKQLYEDESNRKKISDGLKRFYLDESKRLELSIRAKKWAEDNRDRVEEQGKQHSEDLKKRRLHFIKKAQKDNFSDFVEFTRTIHPSQLNDLLNGDIRATDMIMTKCPICGKYEERTFNNTWKLIKMKFRTGHTPYCSLCRSQLSASSYEDEISNIIKSFYDGVCLRNSRDIISPLELDLYYPKKKIAVEYNGTYWHNENCKLREYHYNKFKKCYDLDILLVNIFERDWLTSKEKIIFYLRDLFSGIENSLSYVDESHSIINLNYPLPTLSISESSVIKEDYYIDHNIRVFTCGHLINQ